MGQLREGHNGALALNLKSEIRFSSCAIYLNRFLTSGVLKIQSKKKKMENWNHDKSNTHTLTGIHTAHRGPRPAKSVLALVHLAAGGQKATADCFLVQLVLVHLQLLELPAV